jgi:hypothetical protein
MELAMIETSDAIAELAGALLTFQAEVHGVVKDSVNPHFKNRYASLEGVIETARPGLQKARIAFTQAPGRVVDGKIAMTTMLIHASGQWLRSTMDIPLAKHDPQGTGSAITYAQRYSLMATLGLPPMDDDAESTVRSPPSSPPSRASFSSGVGPGKDALPLTNDGQAAHKYLMACLKVIEVSQGPRAKLVQWWTDEAEKRNKYGLTKEQRDQIKAAIEFRFPVTELERTDA